VLAGSLLTDNREPQPTLPCGEDFLTKIKRDGWCGGAVASEKTKKTEGRREGKMVAMPVQL